jgi:hypothetical protein
MERKPTLREFLLVIWRNWGPLMSGVFSVPFAALAVFTESTYARAIWAVMAILAFMASAYMIWARERGTVVDLQEKLRPKLKPSFDVADARCKRPNTMIGGRVRCDWYRIKVDAENSTNVRGCQGRLTLIKRGDDVILSGENPVLPFAPGENADSTAKTIHPGIPEFLDFLFITDDNQVVPALPRGIGASSVNWGALFSQAGVYAMEIAITSNDSVPVPIIINFDWTLDHNTARLWAP